MVRGLRAPRLNLGYCLIRLSEPLYQYSGKRPPTLYTTNHRQIVLAWLFKSPRVGNVADIATRLSPDDAILLSPTVFNFSTLISTVYVRVNCEVTTVGTQIVRTTRSLSAMEVW